MGRLILALALTGCVPLAPGSMQGFASYDCRTGEAFAWVRSDAVLPGGVIDVRRDEAGTWLRVRPGAPGLFAHEEAHRALMREVGGCVRWQAWRQGRAREIEAHAYCAAARIDARAGRMGWEDALGYWGTWHAGRFGMAVDDARKMIEESCDLAP